MTNSNLNPNTVFILILLLIIPLLPLVNAITGQDSSGVYTVNGQTSGLAANATGFSIRAVVDFISSQFQYPSLREILYRGRFTILKAVNHAPAAPTLEAPTNNTFTNITSTTFTWTNTTDADNDTLSYIFEIYNDSSLAEEYNINNSIPEIATPTQTIVNVTPDGDYYWRVLANDSSKNSSFSELRIITIDLTLPTNFNLTSPANTTSTTDNTPTLEWDASTDTNLQNYTIEITTESDFSTLTTTETATTNTFSNWTSILDADDYYWRVRATDKANNHRQSDTTFLLTITAVTETTTTAAPTTAAGGTSPRPYSFHIIAPPSITIFKDESIVVPLSIENKGNQINLNQIRLSAEADTQGVETTLDRTLINTLAPDTNTTVNLIISAAEADSNLFSVSVTANVGQPKLSDSVRIITNIIGEEETTQESAQQQLIFAKKFFDGNPECQDLTEFLDQAESEIAQGNYAQAHSSLTKAITSCKDLIAVKVSKKPSLLDITFNVVRENRTTAIVSSQVLAFLIILLVIFRKFIKRKPKQPKLDF